MHLVMVWAYSFSSCSASASNISGPKPLMTTDNIGVRRGGGASRIGLLSSLVRLEGDEDFITDFGRMVDANL